VLFLIKRFILFFVSFKITEKSVLLSPKHSSNIFIEIADFYIGTFDLFNKFMQVKVVIIIDYK